MPDMDANNLFSPLPQYVLYDVSSLEWLSEKARERKLQSVQPLPQFLEFKRLSERGLNNHLYVCSKRAEREGKAANHLLYYKINDGLIIKHLDMVVLYRAPLPQARQSLPFHSGLPFP